MKKRLLKPWQTLAVLTAVGVLAACDPTAPPAPKAAAAAAPHASAAAVGRVAPSLPVSGALHGLRNYVGSYPSDSQVNFLEQGPLADRLRQLLGPQYAVFLHNMRTVGPLQEEGGHLFITGNRPHEGGMEAAAVVLDPQTNALRVWMLHGGRQSEWQDPAATPLDWPQPLRAVQRNAQRHTKS